MANRMKLLTALPVFGIDKSQPGQYIAARATSDCTNIRVRRSVIEKRPGRESFGDSMGERVLYLGELDTGATTHFVRIGLTKFEEANKLTQVWTSRANAALTATLADRISVAFPLLSGNRILTYTNGVDAIRKWTGSGNDADLGGTPPKCKFLLYFSSYLILANITNDGFGNVRPWRVQWSDTGDPENWTTGNSGSRELLEDSSEITAVGYFGQYATIHKDNAIYVCYPVNSSSIFQFERKETGAGAALGTPVLSLPTGEQMFLSRDGFRLFNGVGAPLIDVPISDEIREYLNPQHAYKTWAKIVRENDEAWFGVPIGDQEEPSTIFKFNYVTRQIYKDTGEDFTACGDYKNTEGQTTWDELSHTWDSWLGPWDSISLSSLNPIIAFGTSEGLVLKQSTGSSDSGEAIESDWKSKSFSSSDYNLPSGYLMEWSEINIVAKGTGTLTVQYSMDDGTTWLNAGSITLDDDYPADEDPQIIYFDAIGEKLMVRIRHDDNDATFTVKQIYITAVQREEPEA